jgi:Archaeal ATPase.
MNNYICDYYKDNYYIYNNHNRDNWRLKMDLTNPFVIGSDIPVEFFCDREAEVELLQKHVENGRNVVLSSPRRLGKSGLVHHFFKQPKIKKNYATFFVDIYATKINRRIYIRV